MKNVIQILLNGIGNKRKGIQETISLLKNHSEFKDLCEITDSNSQSIKKNLHWFLGNPFPKNLKELSHAHWVIESLTINNEVNWLFLAIRKGYPELARFVILKKEFENNLLLGFYDKAEIILDVIEAEICYSLWSLENRFLLVQIAEGLASNKTLLQNLITDHLDYDVKFLSIFLSERVEMESGVSNYYEKMLSAFNDYEGFDKDQLITFFTFKLDPFGSELKIDPKSVLEIAFKFSLIDRYLVFLKLCTYSLSKEIDFDFESYLYRMISINKKVEDPVLENIINVKKQVWSNNYGSKKESILEIHELYLLGDYEKCYEVSRQHLKEDTLNFDIIKIHAKASIYLNVDDYKDPFTISQKIINAVRAIYLKDNLTEVFNPYLVKFSYVLESMNIALEIIHFIASEIYNDLTFKLSALVLSDSTSPYFHQSFQENNRLSILELQKENVKSSTSYDYFINILKNDGLKNLNFIYSNPLRSNLINIDYLMANGSYEQVIIQIHKIFDYERPRIGQEKLIRRLFYSYVSIQEYDQAIELFVTNNQISKYFTSRLDTKNITTSIKKNRFRNVSANIFLPLFYNIIKAEEVDIFNALKLFLLSNESQKPSELLYENIQPKYCVILLLNQVCKPEILKHSTVFSSPKEVYIERINILHLLQQIDTGNSLSYEAELQENTKRLIVLDGIKKLDESKIYINEDGIYESELKRHESLYKRVKTLIDLYFSQLNENKLIGLLDESFSSNLNPIIPSIKEIFHLIRHEFLFSKFGLVNYLSTRIRHGIFESAIRLIFEKLNLVTEKGYSGTKYLPNDYWLDRVSNQVNQEKLERLNSEFSNFSSKIDNSISKILSTELQIRTESKNKDGLFNFSYSDQEIRVSDILTNTELSFKEVVENVFEILWKRNELNLNSIREFIKVHLNSMYDQSLTDLEIGVQKIIRKELLPELFINISACRGELHKELENISNWFVRTDSQMSDFYLSDILDIITEYINRSSLSRQINLIKNINANIKIQGRFYVNLSDLFRLFLANAIKHSFYPNTEIPINVESKFLDHDMIQIEISNPLGDTVDLDNLREKLNEFQNQLHNNVERLTGERNSGLLKAKNIIKSDLGNESNDLTYFINNECEFKIVLKLNKNIISL